MTRTTQPRSVPCAFTANTDPQNVKTMPVTAKPSSSVTENVLDSMLTVLDSLHNLNTALCELNLVMENDLNKEITRGTK